VPIHVRAEPGDYAEACLLPGDPLRAKYIAETFFDNPEQKNVERGMLGYTGTYRGQRVSVQSSGMGCPSAGIVIEELVQLGVKRILRVGTCGGLQPDQQMGDLIVALSAVPADATPTHLIGGEPHAPTASWSLVHEAVHGHFHERPAVNKAAGQLLSLLFLAPFDGLCFGHLSHHALNPRASERPEFYDPLHRSGGRASPTTCACSAAFTCSRWQAAR